jgi:urease accessory protein
MSLAQVTDTDVNPSATSWLWGLLQTGDSFYPTGSYAHSFGLESLVSDGVVHDVATLREFIKLAVLPALESADLPIVAHAWWAFHHRDWAAIERLSLISSASRPAQEARAASENIGRQRAELAARLYPNSIAPEFGRRIAKSNWPASSTVSAALESCVTGAPLAAAMISYAYATLTSLVAAAMKLMRIGQNSAQTLLHEALSHLPAVVECAQAVPEDEIGWSNPWLDIAQARHEHADARMFIS